MLKLNFPLHSYLVNCYWVNSSFTFHNNVCNLRHIDTTIFEIIKWKFTHKIYMLSMTESFSYSLCFHLKHHPLCKICNKRHKIEFWSEWKKERIQNQMTKKKKKKLFTLVLISRTFSFLANLLEKLNLQKKLNANSVVALIELGEFVKFHTRYTYIHLVQDS